ncbi:Uncharacterised protein [Acinetobacter baumannii]|uniref:hypothetical protein n=2 Tax=Acinetobacter baumannii TaxID=470 RepID=UPI000DE769B6|nr:hypothetical protein [Acinetobacter baumannii]MBW3007595.1 hypothetical protein [Acinetobacter baumannii]MCJ9203428.1 hypothetical protein [Acinetobacter baumannii]MCJ9354149.1 hypothetical protein [Acinetobacter baumannii]SSO70450.1 Uncharacterised protein [Acinetobacter baumannii]SST80098.1 Uncharacterised protein [Acinetobacter baumannii]
MLLKENKTYFIKPNHCGGPSPKLDPTVVCDNKVKKIETTLILDTNILIKIERIVKNGNKWSDIRDYGLGNLVKLLQKCPPKSICLSPALALKEMPPQRAANAKIAYEEFCAKYLGFGDTPNSTNKSYEGTYDEYGFKDLSISAQQVLAIPYLSFLYLNYVYRFIKGSPLDRFKAYIDLIEEKVDVLSATELEIAKYCFYDLTDITDKSTKVFIQKIRENSVNFVPYKKNPRLPNSSTQLQKTAFNAANDVHLLQAANMGDGKFLDGIKQDCWVATLDKKLASFCTVFHQLNINGEVQPYSVSTLPEAINDLEYWNATHEYFSLKSLNRIVYNHSRSLDPDKLLMAVDEATLKIENAFKNLDLN